jgi:hypothetical protein
MKELINSLFSHGDGAHRESGLDSLFEFMDERMFSEADCGA